jgi:hypothetical protein
MVLVEEVQAVATDWPAEQVEHEVHTVALAALENFPLSQATHLVSAVELQAAAVYVPAEHTEQV